MNTLTKLALGAMGRLRPKPVQGNATPRIALPVPDKAGGMPLMESQNWQAGFLPGVFQGTYVDPRNTDIEKLIENIRNKSAPDGMQRKQLDLLAKLNQSHAETRPGDALLEARIQSFELAYRMQTEATDAFDVNREP